MPIDIGNDCLGGNGNGSDQCEGVREEKGITWPLEVLFWIIDVRPQTIKRTIGGEDEKDEDEEGEARAKEAKGVKERS